MGLSKKNSFLTIRVIAFCDKRIFSSSPSPGKHLFSNGIFLGTLVSGYRGLPATFLQPGFLTLLPALSGLLFLTPYLVLATQDSAHLRAAANAQKKKKKSLRADKRKGKRGRWCLIYYPTRNDHEQKGSLLRVLSDQKNKDS